MVVVGRRGYCDVVIDHSSLSKRHCVLVKTDGLLVVRDLISTNGTKVKGQKVRWAALLPDDRITMGNYKLRVYLGPDEVPGPSELHQARQLRSRSQAQPAGAMSLAAEARVPAASGSRQAGADEFPAPSPLEIAVSPSDHDMGAGSMRPGTPDRFEPMIPIILDDSDEIIDLD